MRIAITGGTGSLGRELIAQLANQCAERIVTLTRDQHKRQALQAEYSWNPAVKVYSGDIRDEDRLKDMFAGCEVVVHAAARKVVSNDYDEPREMLLTNVLGTRNVLSACRAAKVKKLLFISSDKAVNPINVYGTSKKMAEQLVLSENARSFAQGMRCSVVRYGNVLASNGSVVEVWQRQAKQGTLLTISDEKMTRFWLTIPQAARIVLKAVADMRGGEIFVPLLKAAPLVRLLAAVIPEKHNSINVGIRPGGEKMHEVLLDEDEVRRGLKRNGWIIVPPVDSVNLWDRSPWLGDPIQPDFCYCSHSHPDQWTVDELREALH